MSKKVIKYVKCKVCGEVNLIPEQTKGLKCYSCNNFDWQSPINETEERTKQKIREMVKNLLPSGAPLIEITDTNLCDGDVCPGWFTNSTNTISIPRKTLYLPRDEIADTTAHESAHKTT